MKKYFIFLIPLCLSSCTSIKFVTVEKGAIVTDKGEKVSIVGNPPLTCHYENSPQVFSGYFMHLKDDGTIVLDDFGRGTIELMDNPVCKLELE